MSIPLLALLGLTAAAPDDMPALDAASLSILVLDVEAPELSGAQAGVVSGLVVEALARHRALRVLSSQDIRRVADLAAQKQLVGCATDSCLAEIADAMGARYVVYGQAARLGEILVLQLSLFDSARALSVGRERVEVRRLDDLSLLIEPMVDRLAAGLSRETPPARAATTTALPVRVPAAEARPMMNSDFAVAAAATAGVGVVLMAAGALTAAVADATLQSPTLSSFDERNGWHVAGTTGVGGAGVGAVVVLVGGGLLGAAFLVD